MSCIDLHVHFLPGVDDGPSTLEETVAMLRVAHASGTRTVVATPHLYTPRFSHLRPARLREVFGETVEKLEELADEEGTSFLAEMELHLGAEHLVSPSFLTALEQGEVLPMAGTRYLLVEFPNTLPQPSMAGGVRWVISAGYVPVLAHVERYQTVHHRPEGLGELLDLGCVAQLNLGSPNGSHGLRHHGLRHILLSRGLVQIIATDAHDAELRPPRLGEAGEALGNQFNADELATWTRDNPSDVLDNKPLRRGWVRS